jgi:DnaJ homolog subfamily C member 11
MDEGPEHDAHTVHAPSHEVNYYAVLNVPVTASPDEIRHAYRIQSRKYHPNMQAHNRGPDAAESRKAATKKFHEIQKAYDTLIDEKTRCIYDLYGVEGLSVPWDISEYRSLEDLKERLRKQQSILAGMDNDVRRKSEFIFKTNALYSFGSASGRRFQWPEVAGILVSHGVKADVTEEDQVSLDVLSRTDSLHNHNAGVAVSWRRKFGEQWLTLARFVTTGEIAALEGTIAHEVDPNTSVYTTGKVELASGRTQGEVGVHTRVAGSAIGYAELEHGELHGSGFTVGLHGEGSEKLTYHVNAKSTPENLLPEVGIETSYQLTKRTVLKLKLKTPLDGEIDPSATVSAMRKIGMRASLGYFVKMRQDELTIGLQLTRLKHNISLPVVVSDDTSLRGVAWAIGAPAVVWSLVRWLVIEPRRRVRKREKIERARKENGEIVARARQQAQADINLMHNRLGPKVQQEEAIRGLIIINAWYGNLSDAVDEDGELDEESVLITDVRVPLQMMVEQSKLKLSSTTKADFDGFHDPCPHEGKQLVVRYLFHDTLHEVTIHDDEKLEIPKASHVLG